MAPKLCLAPQQALRRAWTRSGASDGSQRSSPGVERQNDLLPSIRSSSPVNAASRIIDLDDERSIDAVLPGNATGQKGSRTSEKGTQQRTIQQEIVGRASGGR